MNAHDLALRLADDSAGVAAYLLPRGKKASGEWKAGSVSGEEGQSLSVRLTGAKKGLWHDFAADQGGDLLDLWAACRSLSIAEAMVEAKAYLGIRHDVPHRERPSYKRPSRPQCQTPKAASKSIVAEWLIGRGITEATIAEFKIGEQVRDGKTFAVMPYLRDGELVNCKYRDVTDKRGMRQEAGAEPCLFGWHLIDPRARTVAITEGELDTMTLHQCGIPALSVNAGAGNHQWIENDWQRLERFSDILVCFDDDEAGQKGAAEVIQRLGIERCRLVKFGAKDANQWLIDGACGEDFHHSLKEAKAVDPEELVAASAFLGQVRALFWPAHSTPSAPYLAFGRHECEWFEFRPGEYTVWTGINGHGKSLMHGYVMLGLMHQGESVCVFSGEMQPARLLKRLVKQAAGVDRPTLPYIDAVVTWLADRMWIFNVLGTASIDRLLEVFRYGAKRYGIRQFVIDSLMMTDVPEDGPGAFTAQKVAMQKIATFAKKHGVHVHLVAHPRKAKDESAAPGKLDVGGSGKITDAADNVFSVWSARKEETQEDDGKPDALLELHKQRHGDVQHRQLWLYFNRASQQYTTNSLRRPVTFVRFTTDDQHSASLGADTECASGGE
jgi:twinkle protein